MSAVKGRICLVGATGRMGQRVQRAVVSDPNLALACALQRTQAGNELSPGVPIYTDPATAFKAADVVIDFSAPAGCAELVAVCAKVGVAYLVASSALQERDETAMSQAAQHVAVLSAANLSAGVNVMFELARLAAQRLPTWDIEIAEIHHRGKRDAPGGTAYALGEAIQHARGPMRPIVGRHGVVQGGRGHDELGYAAMRGGDVAGEHTVYYFGPAERLELTHRATSGDIWATGALTAAQWLRGRPAGRYYMHDVLRAEA